MRDDPDRPHVQSEPPPPIRGTGHTYASVADKISAITLSRRTPRGWLIGFGVAFLVVMVLLLAITYLLAVVVGVWGITMPVAWGFAIVDVVWWIGIGHAGTLISAILLLMREQGRTSVDRFAEAVTSFAVAWAGLFRALH